MKTLKANIGYALAAVILVLTAVLVQTTTAKREIVHASNVSTSSSVLTDNTVTAEDAASKPWRIYCD